LEIFLAISDPNNHGVEFIHIERKKETGKTDEIEKVLPKPAEAGDPRGFPCPSAISILRLEAWIRSLARTPNSKALTLQNDQGSSDCVQIELLHQLIHRPNDVIINKRWMNTNSDDPMMGIGWVCKDICGPQNLVTPKGIFSSARNLIMGLPSRMAQIQRLG